MSLAIRPGRTLALVGESGCGKTTVGKASCSSSARARARWTSTGRTLTALRGERLRRRRADFQIVFQDPYASLNPRMRVHDILMEGMSALGIGSHRDAERERRLVELLGAGRAAGRGRVPLSARVLRRAAPADRDRARARGEPEADRVRRADQRARRLGAGADPQPAEAPAARPRPRVSLHHAQPRGRRVPRRTRSR